MTIDAGAADSGALSVDQATAIIGELPRKEQEAPQPAAQQEAPAQDKTESAPETEQEETQGPAETQTESEEGETETEAEGAAKPELPVLEPPQFLKPSVRANWANLPREVQEGLIEQDAEVRSSTGKSLQQAAEERKAANEARNRYSQLADTTAAVLEKAQATFKGRWENVDWNLVTEQYGSDQAFKLRIQMEEESKQIQQLEAAKNIAVSEQQTQFKSDRAQKFHHIVPDFVDPKTGPETQQKVVDFLRSAGVPDDVIINRATAEELALAYDAYRWRNAQAKAKELATTPNKQPAPKKVTPAKPGAVVQGRSTQQARIDTLNRKTSLTIDEAVELANLKGQT